MHTLRQPGPHDGESFEIEIAKQIPGLRSLAMLLTRNDEIAADLTQDTLAKAWKARSSFEPGTNLRAWLSTIMRNHFRSEARRTWRQIAWDEASAERIAAPDGEQLWSIELADVTRAIGTLSKRQRDALILAGVGGLSSKDIGRIIGCHQTAVKSRVSRARHAVHSMIEGKQRLNCKRSKRDTVDALVSQSQVLDVIAATVAIPTRRAHPRRVA